MLLCKSIGEKKRRESGAIFLLKIGWSIILGPTNESAALSARRGIETRRRDLEQNCVQYVGGRGTLPEDFSPIPIPARGKLSTVILITFDAPSELY